MSVITTKDGVQIADFEFGFTLDGKAVDVTHDDDGSFYIEGLASDFDIDRQDEAFEPGAFEEGLKSYMQSNPILLYHHKTDTALGQVVSTSLTPQGLHVKARVDAPEPGTLVADYVKKIKKGTLRGFSVGGRFLRRMTKNGPKIFKADIGEFSVTPYPVNPRTLFTIATKAFESKDDTETIKVSEVMSDFERRLAQIDEAFDQLDGKAVNKKDSSNVVQGVKIPVGQLHPDAAPVAELLMHQQKIHTLAENTKQNATDPEVAQVAADAQKSAKKHSQKLHQIAARIGPLPPYYNSLA